MQYTSNASAPSHEWRGMLIRELTDPAAPFGGSLVEVDCPAGTRHPVARTTKCETYYYCVRGEVAFEAGGRSGVLQQGDLLVVDANEWYSYSTEEPALLLSFNAPPWDPSGAEYREDPLATTTQ